MIRDGQAKRIAGEWSLGVGSAMRGLRTTGAVDRVKLNEELGYLRVIIARAWRYEETRVRGARTLNDLPMCQAERDVISLAVWVAEQTYEGGRPVSLPSWGAENLDYTPPAVRDYDPAPYGWVSG